MQGDNRGATIIIINMGYNRGTTMELKRSKRKTTGDNRGTTTGGQQGHNNRNTTGAQQQKFVYLKWGAAVKMLTTYA